MVSNSKKNSNKNNVENAILSGVLKVLDRSKMWTGTMTDLNNKLVKNSEIKKILPRSPSALRVVLNRVLPRLRNRGVSIRFGRTTDRTRTRFVKFFCRTK